MITVDGRMNPLTVISKKTHKKPVSRYPDDKLLFKNVNFYYKNTINWSTIINSEIIY